MDLIDFLTTWFWYVMAFLAGMLVAWLVAGRYVPARSPREAIEDALAAERDDDVDDRPGRERAAEARR
ncbi:MAG: hypothetical protein Q4G43_06535 [Mobilicoccus sp.]|nr:hypothetical protein [Mobilicoccus sp.]